MAPSLDLLESASCFLKPDNEKKDLNLRPVNDLRGQTTVCFPKCDHSDSFETRFHFTFPIFFHTLISSKLLHNHIKIPQQLFSKNRGGQRTHHSAIMSLQKPICLGEIRSSRVPPRETRSLHLPCPADSPGQETTLCRSGSPVDGSDRFTVS